MQTTTMIMAPLGIVAIVSLTWLFGGRRDATADEAQMRALLLAEYPDVTITDEFVTGDGCAIFRCLRGADGALGIVRRIGDGFAVRCFGRDETEITVGEMAVGGGAVRLRFPDPAFPPLRLKADALPPWLSAAPAEEAAA